MVRCKFQSCPFLKLQFRVFGQIHDPIYSCPVHFIALMFTETQGAVEKSLQDVSPHSSTSLMLNYFCYTESAKTSEGDKVRCGCPS